LQLRPEKGEGQKERPNTKEKKRKATKITKKEI
jgi:hypothetical protein